MARPKRYKNRNKKCKRKVIIKPQKPVKYSYPSCNVKKLTLRIRPYEEFHNKYLNYDEIEEYLKKMQRNFPIKFELKVLSDSSEKRPIYLVIIKSGEYNKRRICTFIEGGSNGYDQLAVSSALFLIDYLTRDTSLTKICDYCIIPCSNPDTYHKSMTRCCCHQRNTSRQPLHSYPIILGNTNIDNISSAQFLNALKSWKDNTKNSSPPDVSIYEQVFNTMPVKLFVSLQEGSSHILYPFGFCDKSLPEEEDVIKIAESGKTRMKILSPQIGSSYCTCGFIYGTIIDYLKVTIPEIKFMYIFQLKERSFCRNTKDILIYGEDVLLCVKSMVRNVYMYYNRTILPTVPHFSFKDSSR